MKNWKRIFLIGGLVALSSQLYVNLFTDSFRISGAIVLLPVLLVTAGRDLSSLRICTVTAGLVFLLRFVLAFCGGSVAGEAAVRLLPNAVFYLCYGVLFCRLVPHPHMVSRRTLIPAIYVCDLASNLVELFLSEGAAFGEAFFPELLSLALIALARTLLGGGRLAAGTWYRALLRREEHEKRYRRLFLMTSDLKNEVYFMRKNSEEIESVMGNAYRLYEQLSDLEVPAEVKQLSLAIARDVHEIKKDYFRIIQGIEAEIAEEYDEKRMHFRDILRILETTTAQALGEAEASVRLDFHCGDDFQTQKHTALTAVLKNLVTNAVEAIEGAGGSGGVQVEERREGDEYLFIVSDDGPGIAPRHLPHIFQMGYSTKFDEKTGNIYRGVGLWGVRTAVEEQFGGSIEVASEPGEGAVFTLRIPAASLEEVQNENLHRGG
ncbi:MAG: ATP-binding protein [Lachnospiraceae bacterium]|nr:ATP-binding protein [Lachnospiraceae bacterium]